MEQSSGLSQLEMRKEVERQAIATVQRMRSLNIQFPLPVGNTQVVTTGKVLRHYRATRTLPGKAIGSSDRIEFMVFVSVGIEEDQRLWQHVSFTRQDGKMPTYVDIAFLKDCFFPKSWAIQVFPQSDQHVSDHNSCFHLWSCLENDLLPDFRKFGSI